jgi:hypothetical protein
MNYFKFLSTCLIPVRRDMDENELGILSNFTLWQFMQREKEPWSNFSSIFYTHNRVFNNEHYSYHKMSEKRTIACSSLLLSINATTRYKHLCRFDVIWCVLFRSLDSGLLKRGKNTSGVILQILSSL